MSRMVSEAVSFSHGSPPPPRSTSSLSVCRSCWRSEKTDINSVHAARVISHRVLHQPHTQVAPVVRELYTLATEPPGPRILSQIKALDGDDNQIARADAENLRRTMVIFTAGDASSCDRPPHPTARAEIDVVIGRGRLPDFSVRERVRTSDARQTTRRGILILAATLEIPFSRDEPNSTRRMTHDESFYADPCAIMRSRYLPAHCTRAASCGGPAN
ncbi:hypothetical protein GGX14DRAFT_633027 [Mycena pura]|uniref:Uncharacterized protein n=1 Tax=Mycena pura TaxID=153505 RepID=A0AAD6Y9P2_9AGAR|nr:hypothetical protein GGX14DRAFT_633027 [Mycena pura]